MSKSKRKGTAGERQIVDYLKSQGWPAAERRALAGTQDRGDIAGVAGVVIEAKNCRSAQLAAWVDESLVEQANDQAAIGVVWHKRAGKGSPADWYVTMTGRQFVQLLADAGYADPAARQAALDAQ